MSENSETQTDWEVEDKIRFLLENLIVDIGVQVTDDYKDKNGLYEGMSIKNVRSRNKYIKLFVELLADARREVKTNIKEILSERKKMTVGAKVLRTFLRIKTLEKESLSMAYEDGFENAIRQVLATLRKEEQK